MDESFFCTRYYYKRRDARCIYWFRREQKVSTILVTHYVEEALYLGQKIIVMTASPGNIYKIIDNPLFGDKNFRDREIFNSLSKEIRSYLKKAGSKNER